MNEVTAELHRSDVKAAGVGTAAGAGIAMMVALSSAPPPATGLARTAVLISVGLLVVSLGLVLASGRPQLHHDNRLALSFSDFARLTPDQLIESVSGRKHSDLTSAQAQRLASLSRLAVRKYRLLRTASDMLSLGLTLGILAAVLILEAH